MKNFIQHRLRQIIEGRLASHTPSNPVGSDKKNISDNDLIKTMHKIVYYNNQYGQDAYFQNTHEGDGIYLATIHTNGQVTIKTPNTKRKLNDGDIGSMWNGPYGNRHVLIKAYRGIEHPSINEPRTGQVRTKSPAEDVAIKTYLSFGKEILEFVKQNMENEDAYTSDDKNFTHKTDDKWKYKYDKFDKEQEKRKNKEIMSIDPEKAAEMERKQAELQAKYDKIKQRRGI